MKTTFATKLDKLSSLFFLAIPFLLAGSFIAHIA
jgi:hypothetical protein